MTKKVSKESNPKPKKEEPESPLHLIHDCFFKLKGGRLKSYEIISSCRECVLMSITLNEEMQPKASSEDRNNLYCSATLRINDLDVDGLLMVTPWVESPRENTTSFRFYHNKELFLKLPLDNNKLADFIVGASVRLSESVLVSHFIYQELPTSNITRSKIDLAREAYELHINIRDSEIVPF